MCRLPCLREATGNLDHNTDSRPSLGHPALVLLVTAARMMLPACRLQLPTKCNVPPYIVVNLQIPVGGSRGGTKEGPTMHLLVYFVRYANRLTLSSQLVFLSMVVPHRPFAMKAFLLILSQRMRRETAAAFHSNQSPAMKLLDEYCRVAPTITGDTGAHVD